MKLELAAVEEELAAHVSEKGPRFDPAEEAPHLIGLCEEAETAVHLADYEDAHVAGIGGSGIILRAIHTPTGIERALKFPRKRLYTDIVAAKSADAGSTLVQDDPELRALERMSHQNITRLYEAFQLGDSGTQCVVTEYVETSTALDAYAVKLCDTRECRANPEEMGRVLRHLGQVIFDVVDAMAYMHDIAGLYHFDIKPENILVTPSGRAYVTDMGFARDREQGDPDAQVRVGFTWAYAHPRLTNSARARISREKAKSSDILSSRELSPKFDIFAFGRTLQSVLFSVKDVLGDTVHSAYDFGYLHLVSSLCLDGENSSVDDGSDMRFIADRYLQMPQAFFKANRRESFAEIKICLERLLGRRRVEEEVPELDRWYGSTIKVSDVGTTALTPRVSAVINHPALQRLKREKQLGMLDTVFPTATHSRYQHTLGTFHAVIQYVLALYYDPDNPVFRALFDGKRIKLLLVASLVHDLGHSAYGHELEEIDQSVFRHEDYVGPIAASKSFLDEQDRTLANVIESQEAGAWAVSWNDVESILAKKATGNASIDSILFDILDGQIDADKFDYLIRDSVECRVNYGLGIDYDRFLRSLTTHTDDGGNLRLAVKQKGAASAEAFALARYQLYQSLYWHHTFRATKAMLLEAVRLILADLRLAGSGELFVEALGEAYLGAAIGVEDRQQSQPRPKVRRTGGQAAGPSLAQIIQERVLKEAAIKLPVPYDNDATMKFLWSISTEKARGLLEALQQRAYYKRIVEFSPAQLTGPNFSRLRDDYMDVAKRGQMQIELQKQMMQNLHSALQGTAQVMESYRKDNTLHLISELDQARPLFLLDMPIRGWFAAGDYPRYVSDYKRRHFRAAAGERGFEGNKAFWDETLGTMMKNIAFIRVYCDPDVHPIVTRVLSPTSILKALEDAIPYFKNAVR